MAPDHLLLLSIRGTLAQCCRLWMALSSELRHATGPRYGPDSGWSCFCTGLGQGLPGLLYFTSFKLLRVQLPTWLVLCNRPGSTCMPVSRARKRLAPAYLILHGLDPSILQACW